MDLDFIVSHIHQTLTDDLLKPVYRQMTDRHLTTGHCYAASEAAFHLLGGSQHWMSCCGRDEDGGTHWWLKNKASGVLLDVTSQQFTHFGKTPPYSNGRPVGFLTKLPSKRAVVIIERLKALKV